MNRLFAQKALLGSLAACGLFLLSGCAQFTGGPASAADFSNVGASAPLALPAASRLDISAVQALTGSGMYFFDDDKPAHMFLVQDKASKDHYLVKESFGAGVVHGLSWGTGAEALLYSGQAVKPEKLLYADVARNGNLQITYGDHPDMKINMKVEAFDVSGLAVREFLRTRGNQPSMSARFMSGNEKFPKGSIAYATTLWVDKDEVLVPNLQAFTGSDTIAEFSQRFSSATPYCLRFLSGNVVQPMGMIFDQAIKPNVKTVKGKRVEEDQDGKVKLYAAKKDTVFCAKDRPEVLAEAKWNLTTINGTRVLAFDFPGNIPAASFGMTEENRSHLLTGIAEMEVGSQTRAVPVYVWQKGAPVRNGQYRFNDVAAKAIEAALAEVAPARAKWEAANENDVLRRAKAIDAANAPKAVPVKTLKQPKKASRKAVQKKVTKSRAKK